MTKYYCTVIIDASVNIIIDADSPEEAAELALDHDDAQVSICHQCSSEFDLGEAYRVRVYNEECTEELHDTESST